MQVSEEKVKENWTTWAKKIMIYAKVKYDSDDDQEGIMHGQVLITVIS